MFALAERTLRFSVGNPLSNPQYQSESIRSAPGDACLPAVRLAEAQESGKMGEPESRYKRAKVGRMESSVPTRLRCAGYAKHSGRWTPGRDGQAVQKTSFPDAGASVFHSGPVPLRLEAWALTQPAGLPVGSPSFDE